MLTLPNNDNEDDITDKDIIGYLGKILPKSDIIKIIEQGSSTSEIKKILQKITNPQKHIPSYRNLSLIIVDNTIISSINRKKIFEQTFIFTFHSQNYCDDAISGFTESIEHNKGRWIIDNTKKRYFQKYQGSKTVLFLDGKQYGHWDDYTQFVLSNLAPQQESITAPIVLDHTITFKSVEEESMVHDRFSRYSGIIPDLCTYAIIKYDELYHNRITSSEVTKELRERIENIKSHCSL